MGSHTGLKQQEKKSNLVASLGPTEFYSGYNLLCMDVKADAQNKTVLKDATGLKRLHITSRANDPD